MISKLEEFISILDKIGKEHTSPEVTKALGDIAPLLDAELDVELKNVELQKPSPYVNDNKIANWAMSIISLIPEIMQNKNDPLPVYLRQLDVTKIDLANEVLEVYFGKPHQYKPTPRPNR